MTTSDLTAARERATAAYEAGFPDDAYGALRDALADVLDAGAVNDLAVIAHSLGRADEADALLRAAHALAPEDEEVAENLAALRSQGGGAGAWRRSRTLGGDDPEMDERAWPGMRRADVMSEHAARYAFAIGRVGGKHVLDLGCGTGYGSEMLSWSAASVRGFDLWTPRPGEEPRWTGPAELVYGHDLCRDPLPSADVAVWFECVEHLPDAPAAMRLAWTAVDTIIASFPNPVHHGSWMNPYHLNDWSLEQFEDELRRAAAPRFGDVEFEHLHQPVGETLLVEGRDPDASFWIAVARGL